MDPLIKYLLREKVDFNEVLKEVSTIVTKYSPTKIFIDGANPSFIRSLKLELNEDPEYEQSSAIIIRNVIGH